MTITIRPTDDRHADSVDVDDLADDLLTVDVDHITITDPTVVSILRGVPDDQREPTLRDALRIGARALVAARTGGDAELVTEAINRLDVAVEHLDTAALERATASGQQLLDTVTAALFAPGAPVAETLQRLDPERADGLLARLKAELGEQVAAANAKQRGEVQAVLTETVRSVTQTVAEEVGSIRTILTAAEAERSMFRKTCLLGQSYEDTVEACLGSVLQRHETVDSTGRDRGVSGSMVGDHVVTLLVDGVARRVVVEDKTTRKAVPALLREAREALVNRDAAACLWVTNDVNNVPGKRHLTQLAPEIYVVVIDDEAPDTMALDLALAAVRLDLARADADGDDSDEAALRTSIADARGELDRLTEALGTFRNIKTGHTNAENGIAKAREHVDQLEEQLRVGIRDLGAALTVDQPRVLAA